MELDERFLWRGRRIAWGRQGSGPALVFCHGTPWSSVVWVPFAEALSRDFTVHLWDMPGYGSSSKNPAHAVDLAVQGEAFAALLQHWTKDPAHVVAHGYGGAVALRANLLHEAPFASLTLVDVVALNPWGSPFFTLVQGNADVFARLPAAVHRGAVEAYVAAASNRGLPAEVLAALVAPWTGEEGQAAFYRQVAQADDRHTAALAPLLPQVRTPTHIIWGEDDRWIPVDRAHRLHQAISGSSLSLIPGAGHLVQLDAPVALATELVRWLQRQPRVR